MSFRPEHQKETHFLKRRIAVDDFGSHVELDQRYVKSLLDAMAMNHCKSMAALESKGQESSHVETGKTGLKGTSRVPIWCWNLPVYDRTTLRHCLQYEGNHERGSRTDHSLKEKVEENHALPQRTSAHVTVDADWAGDPKTRRPTSRGVLAIGPGFTVRQWSVTQATTLLSSAESEAKAITKGCIEALHKRKC